MSDQNDNSSEERELEQGRVKATVMVESLRWLKEFHGKTVVIKFGGNAMTDPELMDAFAQDVVYLHLAGIRPVIVHGGGPQISKMLAKLDIASEFKDGYRVTSAEAIDVVRMVLSGQISRDLVGRINEHGPYAVAISGEDAHLFRGRKKTVSAEGKPIDLGFVGDVIKVNPEIVQAQVDAGRIPVVAGIATDKDHHPLNINADAAAAALAIALKAEKLMLLTDVRGLYANWPNKSSLIQHLSVSELREILPTLESGMIPKMQACLGAVEHGVPGAQVIDGTYPHSTLIEIFSDAGIGTFVTPDKESK